MSESCQDHENIYKPQRFTRLRNLVWLDIAFAVFVRQLVEMIIDNRDCQ